MSYRCYQTLYTGWIGCLDEKAYETAGAVVLLEQVSSKWYGAVRRAIRDMRQNATLARPKSSGLVLNFSYEIGPLTNSHDVLQDFETIKPYISEASLKWRTSLFESVQSAAGENPALPSIDPTVSIKYSLTSRGSTTVEVATDLSLPDTISPLFNTGIGVEAVGDTSALLRDLRDLYDRRMGATLQDLRYCVLLCDLGLKQDPPSRVCALLVDSNNRIVNASHHLDSFKHAETALFMPKSIQTLDQQRDPHLDHLTVYTTLEPCVQCAGVIIHCNPVNRIVYLVADEGEQDACALLGLLYHARRSRSNHLVHLTDITASLSTLSPTVDTKDPFFVWATRLEQLRLELVQPAGQAHRSGVKLTDAMCKDKKFRAILEQVVQEAPEHLVKPEKHKYFDDNCDCNVCLMLQDVDKTGLDS